MCPFTHRICQRTILLSKGIFLSKGIIACVAPPVGRFGRPQGSPLQAMASLHRGGITGLSCSLVLADAALRFSRHRSAFGWRSRTARIVRGACLGVWPLHLGLRVQSYDIFGVLSRVFAIFSLLNNVNGAGHRLLLRFSRWLEAHHGREKSATAGSAMRFGCFNPQSGG